MWWAWGTPTSPPFTVTVNLANNCRDPAGFHVTISRISGAKNAVAMRSIPI
jgi:hypothetical protein